MIIINDENSLRIKCEDVQQEEAEYLIGKLQQELDYANKLGKGGIGLAAPQIGIYKKAAIVRLGNDFSLNLINCKVENGYDLTLFKQEGCLSFPGKSIDTMRYQEITIINNLVYPNRFIVSGLLAVAVQHEIDHFNGVLFSDRIIQNKVASKIGPNDLCLCGSNIKYKKCCQRLKK